MLILPHGSLTRADLDEMPDDGRRYELIDGVLVISPVPGWAHQRAVGWLITALWDARPSNHFEPLLGPFDIELADDTMLRPDLFVARYSDMTDEVLPAAPLLAVEVLSPSTRRFDLMVKHSRLEAAGCASYWVVDTDEPAVIAWDLCDGSYVEVAHARGDAMFQAQRPYPVEFTPRSLLAR